MLRVLKRLKERFSGKKGTDKITVTLDANTDQIKAKIKEISEDISDQIEGVTLSDDPKFSESFIAELYKALTDYHQKQSKSK